MTQDTSALDLCEALRLAVDKLLKAAALFVKRRLREIYRQNKLPLYQAIELKGITLAIALMYTGSELPEMKQLEKSYQVILKKIYDVLEMPNP